MNTDEVDELRAFAEFARKRAVDAIVLRDAAEARVLEWRKVACDFHDALVGHRNAGAFNQRLALRATTALDILEAREGSAHPDDAADLMRLSEDVRRLRDIESDAEARGRQAFEDAWLAGIDASYKQPDARDRNVIAAAYRASQSVKKGGR